MINQHPITPPPELVSKWANMFEFHSDAEVFTEVARWGADAELDACCWWLNKEINTGWCLDPQLRASRRPKPPSLKEQALAALRQVGNCEEIDNVTFETLRRALEALPND